MKLRYVTNSPYCRKVMIAAYFLNLDKRIELLNNETDLGDLIRSQNPLNKIPILITDEGQAIYDSSVIVRYLDSLSVGATLYPLEARDLARVMTTEALADGMMDALGLIAQEAKWHSAEQISVGSIVHQRAKIQRGLAVLEAAPPSSLTDAGAIAVASMLGYLDLRDNLLWRESHPRLEDWLKAFESRTPAFAKTAPGQL